MIITQLYYEYDHVHIYDHVRLHLTFTIRKSIYFVYRSHSVVIVFLTLYSPLPCLINHYLYSISDVGIPPAVHHKSSLDEFRFPT